MPPLKDHKHAAFVQSFIESMKQKKFLLVGCEIMFNYYGDRGVIDVVLRKDEPDIAKIVWLICELKPNLVDIGETIRQVRRAEEYFCRAKPEMKIEDWDNEYRFLLVLEANEYNLIQVEQKHRDVFSGIDIIYHHYDVQKICEIQNRKEIFDAIRCVQLDEGHCAGSRIYEIF